MEQRRLRLGDILDDYCPRERRVTNHAVVAMIEDDVKQTRCTTCDAEHAYKGGKEPRRRKKDATSVLYEEVLAGMPDAVETAAVAPPIVHPPVLVAPEPDVAGSHHEAEAARAAAAPAAEAAEDTPAPGAESPDDDEPRSDVDDGPFHRRLIRATLPRPEGQKEVRQVTDFTVRHNGNGRGGARHGGSGQNNAFRGGAKTRGAAGSGNGHNPNGGRRFGPSAGPGRGPSAGPGRGGRPGFGGGNPPRPRNRKRSR